MGRAGLKMPGTVSRLTFCSTEMSIAQKKVDAFFKMAKMLKIPCRSLLERGWGKSQKSTFE